jgi:hypothetical protein
MKVRARAGGPRGVASTAMETASPSVRTGDGESKRKRRKPLSLPVRVSTFSLEIDGGLGVMCVGGMV